LVQKRFDNTGEGGELFVCHDNQDLMHAVFLEGLPAVLIAGLIPDFS